MCASAAGICAASHSTVADRHEPVVAAVVDAKRAGDGGQVEAPRVHEGLVVARACLRRPAPAPRAVAAAMKAAISPVSSARSTSESTCLHGLAHALRVGAQQLLAHLLQPGLVGVAHRPRPARSPRRCSPPCRPSSPGPRHPTAPVPTSAAPATTRSPSSAAQASACGPPPEWPQTAKRSSAEVVGDGDHVGRGVGHRAAGMRRRAAVAGAVVGDQAQAVCGGVLRRWGDTACRWTGCRAGRTRSGGRGRRRCARAACGRWGW